MLPRQNPGQDLLDLAALQGGMLSTEQLHGHGFSRHAVERLIREGHWQRPERSIYFTSGGDPPWTSLAWAGVLLGGDRARVGGSAAGFLHGLLGAPPTPITVLVPSAQVTRARYPWRFRREGDGVRDTRSPGSPPRTTVEDTVLDLCDDGTAGQAIGWVTQAVQSRRTTVGQLRWALQRRRRARHRQLLEDLLGDVAAGIESPLEFRYLRDVERPHGLPHADRQDHHGSPFRRDVAYRRFRLVVELDGRLGHEGMGRFRDMWRDNVTTVGGELTLRYGFFDIAERPCHVARQVGTVLHRQGWDGPFLRCPHCPQNA